MASPELKGRRRRDYPYILDYRTRWSDNDMYDHMNNSVYYFLFDSIVNTYLIRHCGLHPPSSSVVGLVVHTSCDYFAPLEFPAVAEVGLRIRKLGKSSCTYEIAIFEQGVEEVKAVGDFVHVYVDSESRRPAKAGMEGRLRKGLEELEVKTRNQSKL